MATEVLVGTADINKLSRRLEVESSKLRHEIDAHLSGGAGPNYSTLHDAVRDRGEESVADLYMDLGLATIEREVGRLRSVEDALLRVKRGTYGVCVDCDSPIARERLQADAAVARCTPCQTRVESTPSAKDVTPSL